MQIGMNYIHHLTSMQMIWSDRSLKKKLELQFSAWELPKHLGLMASTSNSYQQFWDLLKPDILEVFDVGVLA
jgi:hypothetical protein